MKGKFTRQITEAEFFLNNNSICILIWRHVILLQLVTIEHAKVLIKKKLSLIVKQIFSKDCGS
jgi:hypothetical protein